MEKVTCNAYQICRVLENVTCSICKNMLCPGKLDMQNMPTMPCTGKYDVQVPCTGKHDVQDIQNMRRIDKQDMQHVQNMPCNGKHGMPRVQTMPCNVNLTMPCGACKICRARHNVTLCGKHDVQNVQNMLRNREHAAHE